MATAELLSTTREIVGASLLNLLIVDDERGLRESCREVVQTAGFPTFVAESAESAYKLMDANRIDVVLLDLKLPGATGLEALRQIKSRRPEAIVIIMTGYGTVNSAVQAMKLGAFEFMNKPFTMDELHTVLEHAVEELQNKAERRLSQERLRSAQGFGALVGHSPEMQRLYRIIAKAAQSSHPVLIQGESGTGKELVARCIHFAGPAADKPFIPVDCGAIVPTLIESELFGYVKGAFTGAVKNKDGLLAIAHGGTVFLDEIGELPLELQTKLLRAIQEKEIRPVGSTRRVPVNVRILAATNRNLEQGVADGTFRRDLYFRLNVLSLRLPPLRDRKEDISLLAQFFLERISKTSGIQRTLSDDAVKTLMEYDWPGNVRELENCLERAAAMSTGPTLHLGDLPSALQNSHLPQAAPGPRILPMTEVEKKTILGAIQELKGDKLEAARLLGIGKTTLYRKLKEYAKQEQA